MCRHSTKFRSHVMTWMLTARVKLWWRRMKVATFVDLTPSTECVYLKYHIKGNNTKFDTVITVADSWILIQHAGTLML